MQTGNWIDRRWEHHLAETPEFSVVTDDWAEVFGETQIATQASWPGIVDRLIEVYAPQDLPDDLVTLVADIPKGTPDQMVTAALRLVQDEIRYFGIEMGTGGYIPRSPTTVWDRKFGDCKDKALLLTSILKVLGIKADTVLVSSDDGKNLPDYYPTPYMFDHVIVRVHSPEGDYFVDPTRALQGGIGPAIDVSEFHWGLPLAADTDGLVKIERPKIDAPSYEVTDRYEFPLDGPFAATLRVQSTYRGTDADQERYAFASDGLEDRSDSYLDWYDGRFPGAEILSALRIEDDRDTNTLIVFEEYGFPHKGFEDKGRWDKFWLNPYATKGELTELPDVSLTRAYEIEEFHHRHRVELVGDLGIDPAKPWSMKTKHFDFSRTGEAIDGGVAATFEMKTLTDKVLPDDADAYRVARDAHDDRDDYRYNFIKPGGLLDPMEADIFGGVPAILVALLGALIGVISLMIVAFRRGIVVAKRDEEAA